MVAVIDLYPSPPVRTSPVGAVIRVGFFICAWLRFESVDCMFCWQSVVPGVVPGGHTRRMRGERG